MNSIYLLVSVSFEPKLIPDTKCFHSAHIHNALKLNILHAGNKCVYVPVCSEYFVMLSLTRAETVRQREFIKDGLLITRCAMKYLQLSYLSPMNLTVFTL